MPRIGLLGLISSPIELVAVLVSIVLAMTVHEFSHALVAVVQGDPTPRQQGRLTLNPARHIDPMGALLLVIAGFGWSKPVQFSSFRFRLPRVGTLLVALAGPLSNFILALLAVEVLRIMSPVPGSPAYLFLSSLLLFNTLLGIFNLLPIPPLDGSWVLMAWLPPSQWRVSAFFARYGMLLLFGLFIVSGLLGFNLLGPVLQGAVGVVVKVDQVLPA